MAGLLRLYHKNSETQKDKIYNFDFLDFCVTNDQPTPYTHTYYHHQKKKKWPHNSL